MKTRATTRELRANQTCCARRESCDSEGVTELRARGRRSSPCDNGGWRDMDAAQAHRRSRHVMKHWATVRQARGDARRRATRTTYNTRDGEDCSDVPMMVWGGAWARCRRTATR
jgi:hypothetical protein